MIRESGGAARGRPGKRLHFGDTGRESASDRTFHGLWICVGKWISARWPLGAQKNFVGFGGVKL
jgi:hypothetical protein